MMERRLSLEKYGCLCSAKVYLGKLARKAYYLAVINSEVILTL